MGLYSSGEQPWNDLLNSHRLESVGCECQESEGVSV